MVSGKNILRVYAQILSYNFTFYAGSSLPALPTVRQAAGRSGFIPTTINSRLNMSLSSGLRNYKVGYNLIMYTLYVIQSLTHNFRYTGFTSNLQRRIYDHNHGFNKSTKPYKPYKLIYTKTVKDRKEARRREKYLKSSHGRKYLEMIIRKDVPAQT